MISTTAFSPAARRVRAGRTALPTLLAFLLMFCSVLPAAATHIRAGDIQARVDPNNLLRYFFTVKLYLDDLNSVIDQPSVDICFGDNTTGTFPRVSKVQYNACIPVSENTYTFSHVFPGPDLYTISFTGNNRNSSILNLGPTPQDLSFYIYTTIRIDGATGPNTTPIFTSIPIQRGAVLRRFEHLGTATDSTAEHDSTSYELVRPQQGQLNGGPCDPATDILSYQPLDQFAVAPGIFQMDPQTGLITWDAPATPGEFNIAYLVYEWRSLGSGVYRVVSVTRRDMQITITGSVNNPPVLRAPADTCVVANTTLTKRISATDPDGHPITLVGAGGPFVGSPAATLTPFSTNPLTSTFRWTPDCNSVAQQPYLATLTARDSPPNCDTELANSRVWRIRVVGPPPQNLRAENPAVREVQLRWDPYVCRDAADSIRIFRKEGSANFTPGACQTGVPKNIGYEYVGSVAAGDTAFLDRNRGRRFKLGSEYCYRIYATWPQPGGGESIASAEACATIPGKLPQLTNATVDATDEAAGKVTVKWTQGNHGVIATIYQSYYRLSRAADDAPTTFTLVRDNIRVNDNVYVDQSLNTEQRQYTYRLEFILALLDGTIETVDTVETATTARLAGRRNGNQIDLTWGYAVPWDNTTRLHYIYRRIRNVYTLIDSVQATATGGAYTDAFTFGGLDIGRENPNCYRILTRGTYEVRTPPPAVLVSTDNYSQESCVKNEPCPPVLALLAPNCTEEAQTCPATFVNELRWTPATAPECATDLQSWRVYFRPGAEGDFTLLATLPIAQLTYAHGPLPSRLGCYAVAAVDSAETESPQSNIVCQENCELFTLPNIITPNADARNDRFEPICASPLRRVNFTVYNRWGAKVYESDQNPRIEWNGTGTNGQTLSDGTYFYRAEVEFDQLNPTPHFYKGWVEIAASRDGGGAGR